MPENEVQQTIFTRSLEDCLGICLNLSNCNSVSFNRTDGGLLFIINSIRIFLNFFTFIRLSHC